MHRLRLLFSPLPVVALLHKRTSAMKLSQTLMRIAVMSTVLAVGSADRAEGQDKKLEVPPEIVVYASELPKRALYEFQFWNDPASPGGKLVGTPNTGDSLDPPPENDPHVTFKVKVQGGVPYRCWIHMKVGPPKGVAKANKLWVQLTNAVDKAGKEVFRPGTGSYLTAQGPTQQGWTWVGCDASTSSDSLIHFRTNGEVTVRLQAGMEGVGFDQFLLSPAMFLAKSPSEAVVRK